MFPLLIKPDQEGLVYRITCFRDCPAASSHGHAHHDALLLAQVDPLLACPSRAGDAAGARRPTAHSCGARRRKEPVVKSRVSRRLILSLVALAWEATACRRGISAAVCCPPCSAVSARRWGHPPEERLQGAPIYPALQRPSPAGRWHGRWCSSHVGRVHGFPARPRQRQSEEINPGWRAERSSRPGGLRFLKST